MDSLLTLAEAAQRLRVPENTLRDWRLRRIGPPSARLGRRVMYREADLQVWIDQQFAADGTPAA